MTSCSSFRLLVASLLVTFCLTSNGGVIVFSLDGTAGSGLLPGNENHAVTSGGTGGVGGGAISYDDVLKTLSINVSWGSGNGFTDLSGDATGAHIHGPTGTPPSGFTSNASVLYNFGSLGFLTSSASSGGISGTLTINGADEAALLAGQTYINVHTATNTGGEIRGQLVVVPEPRTYLLFFGVSMIALAAAHRQLVKRKDLHSLS